MTGVQSHDYPYLDLLVSHSTVSYSGLPFPLASLFHASRYLFIHIHTSSQLPQLRFNVSHHSEGGIASFLDPVVFTKLLLNPIIYEICIPIYIYIYH